jgi:hypothetical protein
MTASSSSPTALARHLFASYHHHKLHTLFPGNCRHGVISRLLRSLVARSDGLLAMETVGKSLEGRAINLVRCGRGRTHVLVWSQMHGDESTGTLALLDVCTFLGRRAAVDPWVVQMLEQLTLFMVPMLNPDGAEQRRRETAASIDMNRDARALMTPEGRLLKQIHHDHTPAFGFNLHDQELSSVGTSREATAIALLAPPVGKRGATPPVRVRALKVAALMAEVLGHVAKGRIARYDGTFEPRAFGDGMQRWGTSTVLIESGHWPDDTDKAMIRRLNVVGLLTSWYGISTGTYRNAALARYRELPANAKSVYDIVVTNVRLEHPSGWSRSVQVGLMFEPRLNRGGGPRVATLKGVGDLGTCARLKTISADHRRVAVRDLVIDTALPLAKVLRLLGAV